MYGSGLEANVSGGTIGSWIEKRIASETEDRGGRRLRGQVCPAARDAISQPAFDDAGPGPRSERHL
jgi:hypothetical protein